MDMMKGIDFAQIRLDSRSVVGLLRTGIMAAVQDLTVEAEAVGGADAANLRSIANGLRLLLAQTSDPEAIAAAMVPDPGTLAAAETRPCEGSKEDDTCTACKGTGGFWRGQNNSAEHWKCLACDGTGKKGGGTDGTADR